MPDLSLYERQPGPGRNRRSLDWELDRAATYRSVRANRSERLSSQLVRDVLAAGRADEEKGRSAPAVSCDQWQRRAIGGFREACPRPPLPGAPAPSRRREILTAWGCLVLTLPIWLMVGAAFVVFAGLAALRRVARGGR